MASALYICYFGVQEPLVQTQVIPYLRELVKDRHEMLLVTFEPDIVKLKAYGLEKLTNELADMGIEWHWLKYHKRFSAIATAWDVLQGTLFVRRMIAERKLGILHGRVHVSTLMAALGRKVSRRKPKLLFDIRGFFPEEYTDAGIWPENGILYRTAKRVERWLFKEAEGFVVLTDAARDILFPEIRSNGGGGPMKDVRGRPVEVIPCCIDLARFGSIGTDARSQMRQVLGAEDRFVIVYVGSFGGWYLTDEMMDLFATAREVRPDIFVLILTQRGQQGIADQLKTRGFSAAEVFVASVAPNDVPKYLSAADVSLSFIRACYSKLSSSPTKVAEYLVAGLPIITNSGVGDIDNLIKNEKVGVIVRDFNRDAYVNALKEIIALGDIREKCRMVSESQFDLAKVGGKRYRSLYKRLLRSGYEEN